MARNDTQTNVRFTKELKEWLREQAAQNKRSLNGELVACVEEVQRTRAKRAPKSPS